MLNISDLRNLCHDKNMAITKHANNRLKERGIAVDDIKSTIMTGEVIRQYEDDKPFPSCLVLGLSNIGRYIHVVTSIDNDFLNIITAYYPDENQWEVDFKSKRRR